MIISPLDFVFGLDLGVALDRLGLGLCFCFGRGRFFGKK